MVVADLSRRSSNIIQDVCQFYELEGDTSRSLIVKRILNKWGYPPDLQEEAVKTVLQQAELLCADWMGGY